MLGGPRMEEVVRRHRRYTVLLGVAFATSVLFILPFLAGNPWHKYWRQIGSPLLLLCLILWIAFVFEAGMLFVFWSSVRDVRKVERSLTDGTHGIANRRPHA
jgi:hypothetical protein